jgi:hypothetical protein
MSSMTVDEKRQQKAMLLLEYQEAEDELASLQEKALRLSKTINDVVTFLNRNCNPRVRPASAQFEREAAEADAKVRTSAVYREAFSVDKVVSTIDEIQSAYKRVQELTDRKAALGLK